MNEIKMSVENYLRTEFEMDEDDIREMLDVFIESMNEMKETVKAQIQASDTAALGETGHAIKGAAANVGAESISEIGKKMESAGKAGDAAICAEAAAEFEKLIMEIS
ncbi:MAG: Hpt domain-containing protein [Kiritimatiellaeota bacterium]|nr:Hpt domain-containing protein [Kiritimatiellota bacterium]